ncbi:hypothetical protein LOK49_LG05G02861 [Camellia lanceoleosa]|uniref:Uncharacterized protein n=1 Tax=Camellia lanceoleosa TaxID=1840588 RepID=A0ACC0HVV6_9ERIC|nr:hypothetical protein LOK49_LG05G02861 [Camellia lanceoleosa]
MSPALFTTNLSLSPHSLSPCHLLAFLSSFFPLFTFHFSNLRPPSSLSRYPHSPIELGRLEKEQEMVVSKVVKKMRYYESTLLSTYKGYL